MPTCACIYNLDASDSFSALTLFDPVLAKAQELVPAVQMG